ncbi:SDR family oxidoreductase [Oryzibacter oryziterrae]|uniref:SDR family oxidoreductase n=1 Tax=Oryzibacter oryziterrae TaxID=2766474 RepID=UPI001F186C21|nr:SDR family oxidoreductase [Oryzibacter oryziterrae]
MATILITGAGRGIGLELCRQYLAAGSRVLATRRPGPDVPASLRDLLNAYPDSLRVISLDVASSRAVADLPSRLAERIDILINNAGVLLEANPSTISEAVTWEAFEKSFQINTIAPLFISRAALSNMTRGGKIATISSAMGAMTQMKSDTTAYRASKAAVNKVMQGLATDLKPLGISVAMIHPGWVRTDMGGPEAEVSPEDSATGIRKVLDSLTLETSGQFFRYDGLSLNP